MIIYLPDDALFESKGLLATDVADAEQMSATNSAHETFKIFTSLSEFRIKMLQQRKFYQ